ncbi:MAG: cytochrome P450 [Pseudolabrys sp.]|nr:cytochrome P450 [Pseudolabrys sp.]
MWRPDGQACAADVDHDDLIPPVPAPRAQPLGLLALLRVLTRNPLEAWTAAHFEEPLVVGGLSVAPVAVVSDPAAVRRVLLENAGNYEKDWLQRRVLANGLTDGLLTAEGHQWRTQRRALAPLFARKTVQSFAPAMAAAADDLIERLARRDGQIVDLAVEATRVTLDVLERTIFSDGFGHDAEQIRLAMKTYFETIGAIDPFDVLGLPRFIPRPRRRRLRAALRLFDATIDAVISSRRRALSRGRDGIPSDILTLLLEAVDPQTGNALSERELRANILTFIAAGHETTANLITWSLYLLSRSRRWRARLQAEADREIRPGVDVVVDRLVETRAVLDEANRLYPPIAAISRQALADDVLAGVPIRRGTMIVIAPYVLHRHRKLWAKPEVFDPRRFLPGARETIDRFAYLPFGVGPRTCIGAAFALQEAAIVVAKVMRSFDLEEAPELAVEPVLKVTLRPRGGLPLRLRRR